MKPVEGGVWGGEGATASYDAVQSTFRSSHFSVAWRLVVILGGLQAVPRE